MINNATDTSTAGAGPTAPLHPKDDPSQIIFGQKPGIALLSDMDRLDVLAHPPMPGIVIFVHGVNSDGEWYTETERGLCDGLNERLKRCDDQMAHPSAQGGQLTPATYMKELTVDGYIHPDMKFNKFMKDDDHFTPVIHFRWGYKANSDELQKYGDGIYLNEENYWGGGPFANGCTSLPDLWGEGLSENLFLFLHIQHLNPVNDRNVYACPPKPYFVLAALRLARLVESIRKAQADVPITIVCHSQGNMVGMAAAFFGDAMAPVQDTAGVAGRCVADSYVLCNPPYSLTASNDTESWSQSDMKDKRGATGRQNRAARIATLGAFFDIIRAPAARRQKVDDINEAMANIHHPFDAATDCQAYGHGDGASTCGRVTLYCNPYDQVISSLSVQGIGWRGMSKGEIDDAHGAGVFTQRVFAQDYAVGPQGTYHYWNNHYKKPAAGTQGYWAPVSPEVKYRVGQGLEASKSALAKIFTILVAPIAILALKIKGLHINALPDKDWAIPIEAPVLPKDFTPLARRFGTIETRFVQTYDTLGQWRDQKATRTANEPYAVNRTIEPNGEEPRAATDAAQGNADSEASIRYEEHARLRMQARREGMVEKGAPHVADEDDVKNASPKFTIWRDEKIKTYLADNIDEYATNHSTIMTNGDHAQKALAYDVAIGLCYIRDEEMHKFRVAADWRFLEGLDDDNPNKVFVEYFKYGVFKGASALKWASNSAEGSMPEKIVDARENPPLQARHYVRQAGHP